MNPISSLKSYLKNPKAPAWSSQSLNEVFEQLDGNMREKQQIVLPIIDKAFSSVVHEMTDPQFHFLRAVTLHTYYAKTRVIFSSEDLSWLLNNFDENPTQQRATLICLLLDFSRLSKIRKQKIKALLRGSLAESFYYD